MNTAVEIKNAFDGYSNNLQTTEERISELEERSTETFDTEMQTEK